MHTVVEELSPADLLRLAIASLVCRSAVRPRSLELNICSSRNLRLLTGLQRLGCLQNLQQITVPVIDYSPVLNASLETLAFCRSLKLLVLKLHFGSGDLSIEKRKGNLHNVSRCAAAASWPGQSLPIVQICQSETWYQIYRWPAGVALRDISLFASSHRFWYFVQLKGSVCVCQMETWTFSRLKLQLILM